MSGNRPECSSSCDKKVITCRKSHKTVVERRRRARINSSLSQIKGLLVAALHKNPSEVSKLEKADILEMAVGYFKAPQYQPRASMETDIFRYKAGFNECATEVMRYLGSCPGIGEEVRLRVAGYLQNRLKVITPEYDVTAKIPPSSSLPYTESSSTFMTSYEPYNTEAPQPQRHLASSLTSPFTTSEEYRPSQITPHGNIYHSSVPFYLQNRAISVPTSSYSDASTSSRLSDYSYLSDSYKFRPLPGAEQYSVPQFPESSTDRRHALYPPTTLC